MAGPLLVPSQCAKTKTTSTKKNKNKKSSVTVNLVPREKASDFLLVPGQVPVSSKKRQQQHNAGKHKNHAQAGRRSSSQLSVSLSQDVVVAASVTTTTTAPTQENKQSLQPRKHNINPQTKKNSANNGKRGRNAPRRPRFGNLPDIEWGSISMDHLREHPHFEPLPLPDDLPKLKSLEDVRNIRQDSWQWDALHDGRCTTSQAVAALGFLEDKAGKELGIPSTWHRRGVGAYQRLQQPALRTLQEMNSILIRDNNNDGNDNPQVQSSSSSSSKLWKLPEPGMKSKFPAKYLHRLSSKERQARRRRAVEHASVGGMGIRMLWGNAQEATSVLTALNYFLKQDPMIQMKEVGMCGAGLSLNQTDGASPSTLLIGATPDALIQHPDGRVEAVEVKNHCPFVMSNSFRKRGRANTNNNNNAQNNKQYTIRELPFKKPYIFPLYVPQLMLEMLCVGPECQSAIMVRQTATSGAMILRIHRDDEWIDEMLYWLQRFQQDFVEQREEPEENFFYNDPNHGPRYRAFLERTKQIANSVDLVAKVPHGMIQRSHAGESKFLD